MKWNRNPVQMLFGNTVGLLALLAYTSFLNYASVLTLVGIFVTSILWAGIAKRKQFVQGILPALVSTFLLQFGYFYSGKEFIPSSLGVQLFLLNLVLILLVSFAGSWVGKFIGNKIRGKREEEKRGQERRRSQFAESIRRLTAIVLIFYINAFVLVPFVSRVYAKEKITTDEFIQNYDPYKNYETHPDWVYEPPKERMPKDNPVIGSGTSTQYQYLTEEQIKEIETKCQLSGCNTQEELEKTNNQQKTNLEEEAKINKLEIMNPEQAKMEKLKNKHLTMDQILKLQKDGKINSKEAFALVSDGVLKGKISAWEAFWKGRKAIQEFVKNNPEAQKIIADFLKHPRDLKNQYRLLSLADKYIGGPFHAEKEFIDAAIVEPGNALIKFAKDHPKEAIISGVVVVGMTVVCIAVPPVGIVIAGGSILLTGGSLIAGYAHGGKSELARKIFSEKTINMYLSGDIWGAVGRGSVELGGLIISNIPDSPGKYVEAAGFIGAVIRFKRGATILSDIRDGIAVARQAGKVSGETIKIGSELIKLGLKNGDEATKLLANYLFNDNNLALLGTISKDVKTAEEVGGLEARQAALKKEFNGLMKMIEGKEKVDGDIIVHVQDRPAKEGTKSVVRAPNNKPKVEPPSFTNKTQWSHSTAGEFKNGIFQGGHAKGSLPSGSTVRKIGTENAQGVYKAEVTVIYDGVPQTRPKTMFPDSWDEPKIKVEVESAFNEREIVLVDKGNGRVDTIYRGKSKSGVTIEFHIDEFDKSYNFFPIYE